MTPSPKLKQKISNLPLSPGCYLFKGSKGKILYVGKAKQLKKRVSSYFQKKDHDPKTQVLVSKTTDLDIILTRTEVEALILENNLIKKHYPRYNLDLKDSRRYAYLKLHSGDYPWLETVRRREGPGDYYGPFTSGTARKHIVDVLRRHFKILMKKPSPKIRTLVSQEDYQKRINKAKKILAGQISEVVEDLVLEMNLSAKRKLYEHALVRREQINALKSLKEKQLVELKRSIDAHIINYIISDNTVSLLVFNIRKGILEGKQKFSFPNRQGIIEEFITQFYTTTSVPKQIILPDKLNPTIKKYLEKIKGSKVSIIVPQKGEKKKLLDLTLKNVEATFFSGLEGLVGLKSSLGLANLPRKIECFDISHLSGTDTVASMVTFTDGKPDKSKYRKFKIRTVEGIDDFLAMEEVIKRRYSKTLTKTLPFPDLIVIDGGKGQLSSTTKILKALGLQIPVISLAKRLEEVFIPRQSTPIILERKSKALLLLRAIRDEAHRFAISYQRLLRKKRLKK